MDYSKVCLFCKRDFSNKQNCIRHTKTCKFKPIQQGFVSEYENLNILLLKKDDEIKERDKKIEEKDKKIEEKERELQSKEEQINFLKGILDNQFSKPTIFNNNNNNYRTTTNKNSNNIAINNLNIKQALSKIEPIDYEEVVNNMHLYTDKYIDQGPEGFAYFLCEHPCKQKFITTDNARNVIVYKTKNNEIIRDPDANIFLNKTMRENADVIIEKAKDRKNYWKDQMDEDLEEDYQLLEVEKIKSITDLIKITKNVKDNKNIKSQDMVNVVKRNGYDTIQCLIEPEQVENYSNALN